MTVQKNENGVVEGEKRGEKVDIALDGFFDLGGVGKESLGCLGVELETGSVGGVDPVETTVAVKIGLCNLCRKPESGL